MLEVTNKRKELTFLKHMLHMFSGLPFALKSIRGDVTAAILHALLGPNEHIYCELPLGFRVHGKVLKLKKSLYGLCQSPCAFWKYLVEKMAICKMVQSKLDPCLMPLCWGESDLHLLC